MSFWAHIKYFTPDEFKCSHCGKEEMQKEFIVRMDMLRRRLGTPLSINSGYRCPDHPIEYEKRRQNPTALPGPHTTGRAADFSISGASAFEALYLAKLIGFSGIGIQQKGSGRYLHFDDLDAAQGRPRPWCWSY